MAVIEYTGDKDADTARRAIVYDNWVEAMVESEDGDIDRHCIPRSQIERVVGVTSGDDIDIEAN